MAIEINEELDTFGSPIVYIKDAEKSTSTYRVVKGQNGFSFYEVAIDRGSVPKELQSQYTSHKAAEKAVCRYLERKAKSPTVKRDENTARREERKKREKMEEKS